jgi:hypothetical protein
MLHLLLIDSTLIPLPLHLTLNLTLPLLLPLPLPLFLLLPLPLPLSGAGQSSDFSWLTEDVRKDWAAIGEDRTAQGRAMRDIHMR